METVVMLPANGMLAAEQIIELAEARGVPLRLLGGLAFKRLCPSSKEPRFYRENKDIDLVGRRQDVREIVKIMETLGYRPREMFNKLSMGKRLIYYDMSNRRRADIFLDEFAMCHKFSFKNSLLPNSYTLPITDLIMTKLQVVEMTDKEHLDLVAGFHDFDVTEGEEEIDGHRIADACAKDWGLYTTFSKSLKTVKGRAELLNSDDRSIVVPRIEKLQAMIDSKPKSLAWRVRARVGEKARWYELPDSDGDSILN